MGLYTRLCAGMLFPLHERLKGHDSVAVRRRLERSQWCTAEQIAADQARSLRAFLVDIGRHVPYYRELFSRVGFDPQQVASVADLQRLPLLGKPEIRAHVESLKRDGHGPLTRYNTGGSSGEPLIFFIGKGRKSHDVAAKWRATRWWGVDIGDRELVVWGSPIELGAQDRVRRVRDGLLRSSLLPAFEMSESKLDGFVAAIRRSRPAMLFGYPSSLSMIGQHAARAWHPARRSGHQGGLRHLREALCRAARDHFEGLRLPGGQRLWRPRRGLHRARVPAGPAAPQCRGHGGRDGARRRQRCRGRRGRRDRRHPSGDRGLPDAALSHR